MKELTNCTCVQSVCRTSNLKGFELRETLSPDHVFISHMLLHGKLHFDQKAAYVRRYFSNERSQSYEERITGSSKKLDRHYFYQYYLDHLKANFDVDMSIRLFLENKMLTILESRWGSAALLPSGD